MRSVVLYAMCRDGNFLMEVTGCVYGRITGKNIYDLCKKFANSNVVRIKDCKIYIDENGIGKHVAYELEHSFKITALTMNTIKLSVKSI